MGMTGRRRYLIKTLVTMAFFLVLALINILTVFSEHLLTTQFSKAEIIARLGSRWIFWILLTPLIYGLSDAFPLERAARKRSLAVHVLASLLTSAAYTLLSASWVFRLGNSPATAISHSVFSYLQPTQIIFYWGLVGISHALRFQGLLRDHEMQALRLEQELAAARRIRSMRREEQEQAMREALRRHQSFELVYITDARGRQVVSNIGRGALGLAEDKGAAGRDWSGRPWFRQPVETRSMAVSEVYVSSATGENCITVSTPLLDEAGGLLGVLAADVNLGQARAENGR